MARKPEFDLATELAKPSFTPGRNDVDGLVALIAAGEEPATTHATAALAKLRTGRELPALEAGLASADDGARARLVVALGLLARGGVDGAETALLAATRDGASRVRRAAVLALGKLGGDAAVAAVLARWDADDVAPDERRALAESLGKLGGDAALARLRALAPGDDAELARRRDRALLMIERTSKRDEDSGVRVDVPPPSPLAVRLRCRAGLGPLLVEELTSLGFAPRAFGDFAAELTLAQPWSALFASRLWTEASIRIGDARVDQLVPTILRAKPLLAAWTRGPIRWRLGFAHGHKRAVVWRVARDVAAADPSLVNDPTATTWDLLVDEASGSLQLAPRRYDDPRFAWRVAEVPAASHPTVAAALAWVAGARPDDRVWDPFCGSGAELVERALRGATRSLVGSDLDDTALAAARANVAAAGITARLAQGDARSFDAGTVDLIITNPPLGSRVHVDAAALLVGALPHFARQLAPRGRLVWITPAHRRTTPAAEALGLVRTRGMAVDLGGVRGHLERWERR